MSVKKQIPTAQELHEGLTPEDEQFIEECRAGSPLTADEEKKVDDQIAEMYRAGIIR